MSELHTILGKVKDPPLALKESLRLMYVSLSRQFPMYDKDMVNAIADHYESINQLLESIEVLQKSEK